MTDQTYIPIGQASIQLPLIHIIILMGIFIIILIIGLAIKPKRKKVLFLARPISDYRDTRPIVKSPQRQKPLNIANPNKNQQFNQQYQPHLNTYYEDEIEQLFGGDVI